MVMQGKMKTTKISIFKQSEKNLGLKRSQRPTPYHGQGQFPLDQVSQNPIQPGPRILDTLEYTFYNAKE